MMPPGLSTAENAQREEGGTSAVKRIILVVTVAAITVAMTTLGVAGLAMAQAPSAEELDRRAASRSRPGSLTPPALFLPCEFPRTPHTGSSVSENFPSETVRKGSREASGPLISG